MALTQTSVVQQALKETYGDLHEQINKNVPALNMFEKSEDARWDGKVFVEALHTGRNHSTVSKTETGLMPVAGKQSYGEFRIPIRHVVGAIELTGQILKMAKSNKAAFVNVAQREVDSMVMDMRHKLERMILSDGRGVLALTNDPAAATMTGGSTTVPIDSPGGVAGSVWGNRFIFPGMQIASYNAAGDTLLAVREVASVSADGLSIVITVSADETEFPNNGFITTGIDQGSSLTAGSLGLEPMGIRGIFDTTTYVQTLHGLDRSLAASYYALVNGPSFGTIGTLTEDILHRALNACHERGGTNPTKYLCHYSVMREFIKAGLPDRRFTGGDAHGADIGISGQTRNKAAGVRFNEQPIEQVRFMDLGVLHGIDGEACKRYELDSGGWIEEDGNMFHRREQYDQYFAWYRYMINYGAKKILSSFTLRGINATVDVNRETA